MSTTHADDRDSQFRQWAMFLHLSALAGYIAFGAGFAAPVVIWQIKKEEFPEIEDHGKMVINWAISSVIYGLICFILAFVGVGFVLLPILGVVCVVFPIVGAIKANNGELWKYPLAIRFFK